MYHQTAFISSVSSLLRRPCAGSFSKTSHSRQPYQVRPRLSPPRTALSRHSLILCHASSSSYPSDSSAVPPPSTSPSPSSSSPPSPPRPDEISQVVYENTNETSGSGNDVGKIDNEATSAEPVKNIPPTLIDSSGALQIDDGSLAPTATSLVPRRLVRRRGRGENSSFQAKLIRATRISSVRSDLIAGFDSGFLSTALLLSLFGIWYWSNAAFNVLNKQALRAFPFPLTVTCVQFAVASVVMASTWVLRFKKPPIRSTFILKTCLPLGLLHAAGFVLTNMSLGKVSVAFTHTVKATEPFFSVALTPSILGDIPTWGIIGSLFPIVAGVAIASATDVSFNWPGFLSAIGSNLMLQSRNVLSKRLMNTSSSSSAKKGLKSQVLPLSNSQIEQLDSLDNINLFTTMTILAFLILVPFTFLIEGFPLITAINSSTTTITGISHLKLMRLLIVGGVYRCLDVLASYMILKRVSPVSHSIGNCVKRAIVIVASVIFFKTKVTTLNIMGTTLALFGVFLYSIVVSACKQNSFGPDSPFCRPVYTEEVELTEGGGI